MRERKTPQAGQGRALDIPALSIKGPILYALIAVISFAGVGLVLAQQSSLDQLAVLRAQVLMPNNEIIVRSPRAGRLAQFYVANGEQVKAGQLLARLDTAALNSRIKKLSNLMDAARQQLADIRVAIKKELLAPQQSPHKAQKLMSDLTLRLRKVAGNTQFLNRRIAAAERDVTRAEIYADVSGRIELIQGVNINSKVARNTALIKIADDEDYLRVRSILRGDLGAGLHARGRVKVVLYDTGGRALGPFEARLHSSRLIAGGPLSSRQVHGEVIYNLIQPRSQIAKQIALQSGMQAKVLMQARNRTVFSQIFEPRS